MADPIIDWYFKEKGCNYWHEQDQAYGKLNFRGKNVVIVGADCGTTVVYALMKGANHIIAYEKDPNLRAKLLGTLFDIRVDSTRVEVKGEWDNEYPNAHVFIQDCEGCEQKDDFTQLDKYEQSCIAIHLWLDVTKLLPHFRGYTITYITPDSKEVVLCKIPNT